MNESKLSELLTQVSEGKLPPDQALERLRTHLKARMAELNDRFEACTWYRDKWTEDRIILRTATA